MKGTPRMPPNEPPAAKMPIAVPRLRRNHRAMTVVEGVNITPPTAKEMTAAWMKPSTQMLGATLRMAVPTPRISRLVPIVTRPP